MTISRTDDQSTTGCERKRDVFTARTLLCMGHLRALGGLCVYIYIHVTTAVRSASERSLDQLVVAIVPVRRVRSRYGEYFEVLPPIHLTLFFYAL